MHIAHKNIGEEYFLRHPAGAGGQLEEDKTMEAGDVCLPGDDGQGLLCEPAGAVDVIIIPVGYDTALRVAAGLIALGTNHLCVYLHRPHVCGERHGRQIGGIVVYDNQLFGRIILREEILHRLRHILWPARSRHDATDERVKHAGCMSGGGLGHIAIR